MNIRNISAGQIEDSRFQWINAFLINGTALIDIGLGYDIFQNVNVEQINSIFVTFPYLEHTGLIEDLEGEGYQFTVFTQNKEALDTVSESKVVELSDNDQIQLGGEIFEVIKREGIMPSLGLYHPDEKILFSGHLLINNHKMIKSSFSKKRYIDLLEHLKELDIERILPAHGRELSPKVIDSELEKARNIQTDQAEPVEEINETVFRDFEHEWNREFENPYRNYTPSEKWMYKSLDPRKGALKRIFSFLIYLISIPYTTLYLAKKYSAQELDDKYLK